MIINNLQNNFRPIIHTNSGLILPSSILAPFHKRFTKNELTASGKKLALIDVNILSRLFSNPNFKEEDIINKFSAIIPVLSRELLTELIIGLKERKKEDDLYIKKVKILDVLQKCQSVYILDHQIIKSFEYLSILKGQKPHEYSKVFSEYFGDWMVDNKPSNNYSCDEGMKGRFIPNELVVIYNGSSKAPIEEFARNPKEFERVWKEGITRNVKATERVKVQIKGLTVKEISNHLEQIDYTCIVNSLLYTILNEKDLQTIALQLTKELKYEDWKNSFYRSSAPYHSIDSSIYLEQLKANSDLKGNDFIDNEHAKVALSYCDILITNDKKAQDNAKIIAKKLRIPTEIYGFNCNNLEMVQLC